MKTIEEAAKECCNKDSHEGRMQRSAFKMGVEFSQRWIPVEEELPPTGELVQIKAEQAFSDTSFYEHDKVIELYENNHKMFSCEQCSVKVTHWRPINLK